MTELFNLVILASIGSIAGLIGGIILLFKKNWADALADVSVPLAAGVLLSVSLLDLFPESVEKMGNGAFSVILIVFVILFLIERFFLFLHHHDGEGESEEGHRHIKKESVASLVIAGDTIHNFLDGVVIGAAFLVNPSLGLVVAFSTFLHETPHEIADFGILLAKGWSRKKAFLANFLSALTTFPGALLTYFFAEKIEAGVGLLLAVATGFFLYVATTDFLPEATHSHRKHPVKQAIYLIFGILIIFFVKTVFPEIGH